MQAKLRLEVGFGSPRERAPYLRSTKPIRQRSRAGGQTFCVDSETLCRSHGLRAGDVSFKCLPYHTVDGTVLAYHGDNG